MMESVGQRIKRLRKMTKTSQKDLGRYCGVSDVAVGYWEKDINSPSGEPVAKLAKFFNTSVDYILYGTKFEGELITSVRRVPVLSWVQAGLFTESTSDLIDDSTEWIETAAPLSGQAFALQVRGDSMTNPNGLPSIPEGAIVFVDPETVAENGRIVVARLDGTSEATIKKLVIDGPTKLLVPLNPRYPTLTINGNCIIIGVVKSVQYTL
ncbi:LexA family transcriptional regulator [Pectobacterium brasiliense]|nr:LexA family transcriptional regulator [Pectobacterium brasiliense]MCA5935659.1 LexA family transcriptional regulator [Pectobacterium brasiliense]MCA5941590.1 LexA family transcriptional regulator [Pectobacterium brasiliense]MCA5943272.1 LexA family transcriptional regulator [Pectobacterium brasiliense]UCP89210.1 LexA family transcriptional regulator [Pectobacterium brasiliense]